MNHVILIDLLKFLFINVVTYIINILCMLQSGRSALQVWGIPSYQRDQDAVVEDEDKEAFKAHVEALFADVL